MPSVPLISASPSFSASIDRLRARPRRSASAAGQQRAGGVADRALAHQRQRAVRQRGEVAGAAEAAVLVDHRGDARRSAASTYACRRRSARTPVRPVARVEIRSSIRARTTSRSTSGPEPAACERIRLRCSRVRGGARDVPGGQRAEPGGDAVVRLGVVGQRLDDRPGTPDLGPRLSLDLHSGVSRATRRRPPGRADRARP